MQPANYRADIDGLRGVAVLAVVFYHADFPWTAGGFVGVDVFFVISGFLITSIIRREIEAGHFSISDFYTRRARRILPTLFCVIGASLCAGWMLMLPGALEDFAKSALSTIFFVSNVWFWRDVSDYFGPVAEHLPLLHTWSLSIEEQFYLGFPLLLLAMSGSFWGWRYAVILVLTLASFLASVLAVAMFPGAAFFLLPFRAWEIGIGVLLGLKSPVVHLSSWSRNVIALLGILAILIPVAVYDHQTPFPGLAAAPPCLGAAALIWLGCMGGSFVNRALSQKCIVFVGLISYSLYLWHWPLLSFLRVRYVTVELPLQAAILALCVAFVLAVLSWRWIEQPFRRKGAYNVLARRAVAVSAGAMVTLAAGSIAVWAASGAAFRFPPDVLRIQELSRPDPIGVQCRERLPENGLCRIGAVRNDSSPPDFLLWGDSHASAIVGAVSKVAADHGLSGEIAADHSCATLLDVEVASVMHRERCRRFVSAVAAYLDRTEIAFVLMASRWPVLVEAALLPGEPGPPFVLTSAKAALSLRDNNRDVVARALPETLRAISKPGRTIVVIGSVPEIGWHVPRHLTRRQIWGDDLPAAPTLEQVGQRQAFTATLLQQVADRFSNVVHLPLAERMCRPVCATHNGLQAYYYDDDHLTRAGALEFVAPVLDAYWHTRHVRSRD